MNPTEYLSHVRKSLQWRHNEHDSVSNHQPHDCLLNRLFGRKSKKTSKLRVTGLCAGNSPGTGEFPAQRASNAENVSIWWRHHVHLFVCVQISVTKSALWDICLIHCGFCETANFVTTRVVLPHKPVLFPWWQVACTFGKSQCQR